MLARGKTARGSLPAELLGAGTPVGVGMGVSLAVAVFAVVLKLLIGVLITAGGVVILVCHRRVFLSRRWKMLLPPYDAPSRH